MLNHFRIRRCERMARRLHLTYGLPLCIARLVAGMVQ